MISTIQADTRAPHEKWPEILHWQTGDEFDPHIGFGCYSARPISVTADGYAYLQEYERRVKVPVRALVGHNDSLITRQVDDQLKSSNEYMELIKQFNIAYAELEARDRRNGIVA